MDIAVKIAAFTNKAITKRREIATELVGKFDGTHYQSEDSVVHLLKLTKTQDFIDLLDTNDQGGMTDKEINDLIDFFYWWLELSKVININYNHYTLNSLGQTIVVGGSGGDDSDAVFPNDVQIILADGKSFGKYVNGDIAPWQGLTALEAILDAVDEYIDPEFTSFSISGQATTVEVGTTLSGSKTFLWVVVANSGVVSTIDIYDITAAATLLAGTSNDGSQAQVITSNQLNANGATQSWRGIANNSSPADTIDSDPFTVTARYYRFYGPAAASPANSAAVRALASSAFHTGATSFNLSTGTVETKFVVALPPGVTISSVIDLDALNANITAQYVLTGTVNVLDAGGTNRSYNIYEMNVGAPYSSSHRHQITTVN